MEILPISWLYESQGADFGKIFYILVIFVRLLGKMILLFLYLSFYQKELYYPQYYQVACTWKISEYYKVMARWIHEFSNARTNVTVTFWCLLQVTIRYNLALMMTKIVPLSVYWSTKEFAVVGVLEFLGLSY